MATKTISLDLEAYERLKQAKNPDESFSAVVKRLVPPPVDLDAWFAALEGDPLDPKTVEGVAEMIEGRLDRSRPGR